jgi:hypothetical protein
MIGATSVSTARAVLCERQDPKATLRAWLDGPWAQEAAAGDPEAFGLPAEPFTLESRQWVDVSRRRAREERGEVVLVRDGPRWWRTAPGLGFAHGKEPESSIDAAVILWLWVDPRPLAGLLELAPAGDATALGRSARKLTATVGGDAGYAGELASLGWGADRWELVIDAETGVLLATAAYVGDVVFRHVEATEIELDSELEDGLFRPPR